MLRCVRVAVVVAALLLAGQAWAQEAPADDAIAGALYDIERAEQQVQGLTPGQGAGIKRVANLLKLTEERLATSPNRSHASWIAANERLTALKRAVADLEAGKMPGQAAEPAASGSAGAASGNAEIAAAQAEVDRLRAAVAAADPSDIDGIVAIRDGFDRVAGQLNAVADKADPGFGPAVDAYNAGIAELNALIQAANSGGGTASGGGTTAASDPNVERALREMGQIESQVGRMQPGDAKLAERLLADLDRIGQSLAAVPDQATESWRAAAAHREALLDAIAELRAQGLQDDLMRLAGRLDGMDSLAFMDAARVEEARAELARLRAGMEILGRPQHPAVQAFAGNLDGVAAAFEERVAAAGAAQAQHGDVAAELAAVGARVRAFRAPAPLTPEAGEADIAAFAAAVQAAEAQMAKDLAWLRSIEGQVPLTVEQKNAFGYAVSELSNTQPQALTQAREASMQALDSATQDAEGALGVLERADPQNPDDQANYFLGKGRYDEYRARLMAGIEAVKRAAAFDAAMGRQGGPDRAVQQARMEQGLADLDAKREAALHASRMPASASDDGDLLEIVEEVLGEQGYVYERAVVNYDLHSFEKMTGDIDAGTVSTTVTVYNWVWDEFQAATAERDGDAWYVFHNRFRYFKSGGPTTPTERWILAERFQGSEILEENIDAD